MDKNEENLDQEEVKTPAKETAGSQGKEDLLNAVENTASPLQGDIDLEVSVHSSPRMNSTSKEPLNRAKTKIISQDTVLDNMLQKGSNAVVYNKPALYKIAEYKEYRKVVGINQIRNKDLAQMSG